MKRETMTNEQKQLDLGPDTVPALVLNPDADKKDHDDYDNPDIKSDMLKIVKRFIKEQNLTPSQADAIFNDEILELVEKTRQKVPVLIFNNTKLSALESIVKYLKENLEMRFKDISGMLNRSGKTIWTTYSNAKKKMPEKFEMSYSDIMIPLLIFNDRKLGVQETIVRYLKETVGLNYHRIAVLLNRDDRTVWTVYNRTLKKGSKIA